MYLWGFMHTSQKLFTWNYLHAHICSILLCLWEASDSVDPVEKYVGEITRKKGKDSTHLYYKLFMALSRLRDFFYCGGKGTTKQQLDRNSMLVIVHVQRISSYIKHQ